MNKGIQLSLFPGLFSRVLSSVVEFFGEAALRKELFFQLSQLLVEQIVALMNETDQGVGGDFGRSSFNIGLIGPIGPIARVSELSDLLSLRVVLAPQRQIALP